MSESLEQRSCPACGSGWRLPLLLAVVLLTIVVLQKRSVRDAMLGPSEARSPAPVNDPAAQTVLLTIDFGNGGPLQNESAEWRAGLTVADLLQATPRVRFRSQGSGAGGFLTEINGAANEGAGGRNWTYSINGKPADKSFGVFVLRPNDHVLWSFAKQR